MDQMQCPLSKLNTTTPTLNSIPPIKRTRRKSFQMYAVVYYYVYKFSGEIVTIRDLKGLYYSREVALHDLIDMLNKDFAANIEYNEEALESWMKRYEKTAKEMVKAKCRWAVEEVSVDDKEKLLKKDLI